MAQIRFPSGRSFGFTVLLWSVIVILAASVIIIPPQYRLVDTVAAAVGIGLMLWIWFGTYYEFRETYLLARMGPFYEHISYGRITSARKLRSMASSMALSSDMLELRHGENYLSGTTYISPKDQEAFLRELEKRCTGIIITRDSMVL
jgi:hypothetical protein